MDPKLQSRIHAGGICRTHCQQTQVEDLDSKGRPGGLSLEADKISESNNCIEHEIRDIELKDRQLYQ